MGKKFKFSLENEEKIIDFVKNNEVLYNVRHKAFRDSELKNRLWLELANELHVDVLTIKKKWKSMRDYYVNSKAKKTTGSAATSLKRDVSLAFLDNTSILKRATISNIDTEESLDTPDTPLSNFEDHELHSIFDDTQSLPSFTECYDVSCSPVLTPMSSTPVPKKRKPNATQETTNDILRELISSRPKASDFYPPPLKNKNKVSTFFDSMAEAVEKFSDVAIARTKMKIAQIVCEEEVKWAEEQVKKQQQRNFQFDYLLADQNPSTSTHSSSSSDLDAKKNQENLFE